VKYLRVKLFYHIDMLASKRILKTYDILLNLLRFSLKNADNPEFREFALINSYLQLLKSLDNNLKFLGNRHMEFDYGKLLDSVFHNDLKEYRDYIDNDEKRELVRNFKLLIDLTNFTIEREGEIEINIIDKEFQKILNLLAPLFKKIGVKDLSL